MSAQSGEKLSKRVLSPAIDDLGQLTLRVPRTRDGKFSTKFFQRYQLSEPALVLALMEMVVNRVSTRKITQFTEELCGTSFSKSTVSSLCKGLDPMIQDWNQRSLHEHVYPFVLADAIYTKVHVDRDRRKMDVGTQILGVSDLAVAENEKSRSSNDERGSFHDQESGIMTLSCQGERGIPQRSEDMPRKRLTRLSLDNMTVVWQGDRQGDLPDLPVICQVIRSRFLSKGIYTIKWT